MSIYKKYLLSFMCKCDYTVSFAIEKSLELSIKKKRYGQKTVCCVSAFRDQDETFPIVAGAEQLPLSQLVSLIVKGQSLDCRAATEAGIRLLNHSHSSSLQNSLFMLEVEDF